MSDQEHDGDQDSVEIQRVALDNTKVLTERRACGGSAAARGRFPLPFAA